MPQKPVWWDVPGVRMLGEHSGPDAVADFVRTQTAVHLTRHSVSDRFRRLGWPLKFDKRGGDSIRYFDDGIVGLDGRVYSEVVPPFTSDKKIGTFNWRQANHAIRSMQALKAESSSSQDTANFVFDVGDPICIAGISDLHIGSWGVDYDTIERITDDLLNTPNLYAYLLGDEEHMAVKMRSVLEVSDNLLPPTMQGDYFESWLDEVQHKILGATWGNHAEMREENQSGRSISALIKKKRVVFHAGMGHADIKVGGETYNFAVSHFFKGKATETNPVHGQMKYLMQTPDREIAMAADTHVPAASKYVGAGRFKAVVNGGTAQTNSGYAKRFFSLKTFPVWPCIVLYPDTHMFTPYFSVAEWLATQGRATKAATGNVAA